MSRSASRPGVTRLVLLTCLLSAMVLVGCKTIAKRVAEKMSRDIVMTESVRLPLNPKDVVRCFNRPGGGCPTAPTSLRRLEPAPAVKGFRTSLRQRLEKEPEGGLIRWSATSALDVLDDKTYKAILRTFDELAEAAQPNAPGAQAGAPTLELEWQGINELFKTITDATETDGWEHLSWAARFHAWELASQEARAQGLQMTAANTRQEMYTEVEKWLGEAVAEDIRTMNFIAAYFRAYFRGGKFFKGTVDLTGVKAEWIKELKKRLAADDAELDALLEELIEEYFGDVDPKFTFGNVQNKGLVTRAGAEYRFPTIEAKLDPTADEALSITKIDTNIVGNDLLRVLLEATFDAKHRLPAVSNATACVDLGHQVNDPAKALDPPAEHLKADDFASVEKWANRGEALGTVLTGRLVRGGGYVALNNESLAGLLETMVGVFVRKWIEKVVWCAYSCSYSGQPQPAVPPPPPPPHRQGEPSVLRNAVTIPLEIRVSGRMAALGEIEDPAQGEAR